MTRSKPPRSSPGSLLRAIPFLLTLVPSCGGRGAQSTGAVAAPTGGDEISRLLPLTDRTVYSYATHSDGSAGTGLLVIEVKHVSPSLVELKSGARRQLLRVASDGVQHVSGGYLLKRPLVPGAQFRGEFGTVHVSRVGISVSVPAGRFSGCLETVEERTGGEVTQVSTKVFCPEVGIVSLHTEAESGDQVLSDWAELKESAQRIDF